MLKGDLSSVALDEVLTALAEQQATGCLHVVDDSGDEALVYLKNGLVYAVSVPGRRPQLGARLISSNVLVPEDLAEALEVQRTELQGWRLGELLVHLGFVEREVVEAFVLEQLRDGFTDLMTWTSGRWRFRKGEKTREDVAPPTSVADLLAEVARRRQAWADVVAAVHGPHAVPVLAPRGGEANVTLDPDTWSVLCKIDGERTVADLARECGFTLLEAGTIIRNLVQAGLVDVEEELAPEDDQARRLDQPAGTLGVAEETAEPTTADEDGHGEESLAARVAALAAAFASRETPTAKADDRIPTETVSDPATAETFGSPATDDVARATTDDAPSASAEAVANAAMDDVATASADALPSGTADASPAAVTPDTLALDDEWPLARVSAALSQVLGPAASMENFVDPFDVPEDVRIRPPAPPPPPPPSGPTEEELRRERIRQAAAEELARAQAEAEALRRAEHLAEVVDLRARREAARREKERLLRAEALLSAGVQSAEETDRPEADANAEWESPSANATALADAPTASAATETAVEPSVAAEQTDAPSVAVGIPDEPAVTAETPDEPSVAAENLGAMDASPPGETGVEPPRLDGLAAGAPMEFTLTLPSALAESAAADVTADTSESERSADDAPLAGAFPSTEQEFAVTPPATAAEFTATPSPAEFTPELSPFADDSAATAPPAADERETAIPPIVAEEFAVTIPPETPGIGSPAAQVPPSGVPLTSLDPHGTSQVHQTAAEFPPSGHSGYAPPVDPAQFPAAWTPPEYSPATAAAGSAVTPAAGPDGTEPQSAGFPDTSYLAAATAMLSEFSRTGATELPQPSQDEPPDEPAPAPEPPAPIVSRELTDTASLLRELSSLGLDDPAPAPLPRPVVQPRPATTKKKRGLFGR